MFTRSWSVPVRALLVAAALALLAGCSGTGSPTAAGTTPAGSGVVSSAGSVTAGPGGSSGSGSAPGPGTSAAPGGTAGSGPGGTAGTPAPLPTEPDGCVEIGTGTVVDAGTPQRPLPAVVLGGGLRAVVLVNDTGQKLCAWLPFARTLSRTGLRVVLYDPPAGDANQALRDITTWLRDRGSTGVGYVGAGTGAVTATVTAAALKPAPYAVVALSPAAAAVRAPSLYAAAASGDAPGAATARRLASGSRLRLVAGTARGTALVATPGPLTTALTGYLR
ncbi:MAG TPA: hypothetical protein VMU51_34400 [Mycobacteriales bacterium]|nr:hypothetical protein [Mycobacteriales bacterium]